jgi:hypothetical protein
LISKSLNTIFSDWLYYGNQFRGILWIMGHIRI